MKIANFTQSELDLFREECNFTDIESKCFEMKARDLTDIQLAMDLNVSESTVAVTMRRVRSKITTVLKHNLPHIQEIQNGGCGNCIVCHTMQEWSRIPDFLSSKGKLYIFSDYRTENDIDIPRIKIGDGIHSLSELPFATMSITDSDMEYWDNKPDTENNDFGKIVEIDSSYLSEYFIFPTDGYIMLEFNNSEAYAIVNIYGASGQSYFEFEKRKGVDIHSKEVFVKKGMKCGYVMASSGAKIKFVPLV